MASFDAASFAELAAASTSDEAHVAAAVLTGKPLGYEGEPPCEHQKLGELFDVLGAANNNEILNEVRQSGGTMESFFMHLLGMGSVEEVNAQGGISALRALPVKVSHPSVARRIVAIAVAQAAATAVASSAASVVEETAGGAAGGDEARADVVLPPVAGAGGNGASAAAEHERASTTENSESTDMFGADLKAITGNDAVTGGPDPAAPPPQPSVTWMDGGDSDGGLDDSLGGGGLISSTVGGDVFVESLSSAAAAAVAEAAGEGLDSVSEVDEDGSASGAAAKASDDGSDDAWPGTLAGYVEEGKELEEIGKGAFATVIVGEVRAGLPHAGERVAIKKIIDLAGDMEQIQAEINMMKYCRNRNMLKMHKSFYEGGLKLCVVTSPRAALVAPCAACCTDPNAAPPLPARVPTRAPRANGALTTCTHVPFPSLSPFLLPSLRPPPPLPAGTL